MFDVNQDDSETTSTVDKYKSIIDSKEAPLIDTRIGV